MVFEMRIRYQSVLGHTQ